MKKMHIVDKIFVIGFVVTPILAIIMDIIVWSQYDGEGGFPICTFLGVVAPILLTILLLIFSHIKYEDISEKPSLVRWWMILCVPYLYYGVLLALGMLITIISMPIMIILNM